MATLPMAGLDSTALPHSEETERAVLGSILLEPPLVSEIDLRPEDFYSESNQILYSAMQALAAREEPIDLRTVQAELENQNQWDRVGGIPYLTGLDVDLPSINSLDSYVKIVRDRSQRRRLIHAGHRLVEHCFSESSDVLEILDRHAVTLDELRRGGDASRYPEAIDVSDFLELALPPRKWLAEGLIQDRDIIMLHATRGCGKSHFSFGLSYALACGVDFLRYKIREPVPVLLCDGEQQSEEIQSRLSAIRQSMDESRRAPFWLLARDRVPELPSLATAQGQALVNRQLEKLAPSGPRVLVIDSLSTLAPLPKDVSENDEAGWRPIQEWLLRLRGRGVTTLFVHHDNKAGSARGTSARETLPSQILHLKRPADYNPTDGARFEVYLEKARGVYGPAALPYEAQLHNGPDGRPIWTTRPVGDEKDDAIRAALAEGIESQREIARRTGIPQATIHRRLKKMGKLGR